MSSYERATNNHRGKNADKRYGKREHRVYNTSTLSTLYHNTIQFFTCGMLSCRDDRTMGMKSREPESIPTKPDILKNKQIGIEKFRRKAKEDETARLMGEVEAILRKAETKTNTFNQMVREGHVKYKIAMSRDNIQELFTINVAFDLYSNLCKIVNKEIANNKKKFNDYKKRCNCTMFVFLDLLETSTDDEMNNYYSKIIMEECDVFIPVLNEILYETSKWMKSIDYEQKEFVNDMERVNKTISTVMQAKIEEEKAKVAKEEEERLKKEAAQVENDQQEETIKPEEQKQNESPDTIKKIPEEQKQEEENINKTISEEIDKAFDEIMDEERAEVAKNVLKLEQANTTGTQEIEDAINANITANEPEQKLSEETVPAKTPEEEPVATPDNTEPKKPRKPRWSAAKKAQAKLAKKSKDNTPAIENKEETPEPEKIDAPEQSTQVLSPWEYVIDDLTESERQMLIAEGRISDKTQKNDAKVVQSQPKIHPTETDDGWKIAGQKNKSKKATDKPKSKSQQ